MLLIVLPIAIRYDSAHGLSRRKGQGRPCLRKGQGTNHVHLSDVKHRGQNHSVVNVERLGAALSIGLAELFRRVEADR